ncbi:MAG: hypothetical protein HRT61_14515 [Ekhidna sp.]|nr:hypothetical protein [Ekhidna sp.]
MNNPRFTTFLLRVFQIGLLVLSFCLHGQEGSISKSDSSTVTIFRVITKDGNQYTGSIIDLTQDSVKLKTTNIGIISIPRAQISTISETSSLDTINGWPYHFQTTNYFASNSGYGLQKGEGYYKNIWLVFNNFSYGITDKFSLGIGAIASFFWNEATPIWVTGRLTTPVIENQLNIGGGVLYGTVESSSFGLFYGVVTVGTRDRNISFGLGTGFSDGLFEDTYINLDATFRATKRFYFVAESYHIDNFRMTLLGGKSILGRSSLEYGILTSNEFDFLGIPILGATLPLHK